MVAVHEAGQHDIVAAAYDGRRRMLFLQFLEGADRGDRAVFDEHGAIRDLVP